MKPQSIKMWCIVYPTRKKPAIAFGTKCQEGCEDEFFSAVFETEKYAMAAKQHHGPFYQGCKIKRCKIII